VCPSGGDSMERGRSTKGGGGMESGSGVEGVFNPRQEGAGSGGRGRTVTIACDRAL
jgi:hypothetical protein